jgi:siroheme synthase
LSARAIAQGLAPATPAVAVANATRPNETVVAGTIADIADRIEMDAPDGPLLVMIGKVLAEVGAATNSAVADVPSPHSPSKTGVNALEEGEGISYRSTHSVG